MVKNLKISQNTQQEVAYYYDSHPTKEDLMGSAVKHSKLVSYVEDVWEWLFHEQLCAIYLDLNFYLTTNFRENPLIPDVALIKGMQVEEELTSWSVVKKGLAPHVVFEVASAETWRKDVDRKPGKYARMGVQEYFFYVPDLAIVGYALRSPLLGWRLNQATRQMEELPLDKQGRLWSEQLESFLVPDGTHVRFYDSEGQLRLTEAEAATQRANAEYQAKEAERRRAELERRRTQAERRKTEVERQRAETEHQRAEAEHQRAEAECQAKDAAVQQAMEAEQKVAALAQEKETAIQRAEALAQKLRALGINIDEL